MKIFFSRNDSKRSLRRPARRRLLSGLFTLLAVFLECPAWPVFGFSDHIQEKNPLAKEGIEVFADQFFKDALAKEYVPGAVFVLVKGQDLILEKGYGFADLERQIPADPDESIFRAGSNAKLLTTIAVLQASDRGLVDLNADIDNYLKSIKVRRRFPQPVTLRRLLTHTSGFDDRFLSQHVRRREDLVPFGAFLEKWMPLQIVPPGKIIIYSDFGMALAGLIVQEVASVPYEEYVRTNIFEPLEMRNSHFVPAPEEAKRLATGYKFGKGKFSPYPYDFLQIPAGSGFNTTAADMAHLMTAVLGGGAYHGRRVLEEATTKEFLSRQFMPHSSLSGMAYGFEEYEYNNQTFLIKAGAAAGFECLMAIFPEKNIGFWLSYNRSSGFYWKYLAAFMDRFFPAEKKSVSPEEAEKEKTDLAPFLGYYRHLPYSVNTFQKIASLVEQVKVTKRGNMLQVFGAEFYPDEPLLFQRSYDTRHIAFQVEKNKVRYLFFGKSAYERLSGLGTFPAQVGLLAIFAVFFATPVILALSGLPKKTLSRTRLENRIRWIPAACGALNLIFLGFLGLRLMNLDVWEFAYGIPTGIKILLAVPILTGLTAILYGILIYLMWKRRLFSVAARIFYTDAWLASLFFIIFLNSWNLLGWRG